MMRSATAIASTSRDSRFAKTNPNGFISDYDAAGIGIDLDLGDLAAVGEVFRNVAQTFTRGVSRKARPDRR